MKTNSADEFDDSIPGDTCRDQMGSDASGQPVPSDSELFFDPQLDLLLSEAKWPEPDAVVLRRLVSFVESELQESRPSVPTSAPMAGSSRMRIPMRRTGLIGAVAAALCLAFLAGRWTSTDTGRQLTSTNGKEHSVVDDADSPAVVEGPAPVSVHNLDVNSSDHMATADSSESSLQTEVTQPDSVRAEPDPVTEKRHRLTQRERMKQQLDSVLACLEEGTEKESLCCQSLMPRRAQFEYLLAEVIRTTTGQRQSAAVTAMGFIGTDDSVSLLLRSSLKQDLRTAAIDAVNRCSSEQMLAAIVLQPGDSQLKTEILTELAHRSTVQAASVWLHLVRTEATRNLCLQVVDELSPAMVNMLFAELDAPVYDDRIAAILSLGRRLDEETLQRANRLCVQFPGRWEPVAILMWNGSEQALGTLSALQEDPDRYAVIQTASIQLKASLAN